MRTNLPVGKCDSIEGLEAFDKIINIDQSPIGRSPRSNPATYVGVFDAIRDLYASLPESKARGYQKGRFSFNVKGGRCENCQGEGRLRIKMQFMSDIEIPCEECKGKCYKNETLEIKINGKSIYDVLQMTVDEAIDFFGTLSDSKTAQNIQTNLQPLHDVGLGYLHLAQSSSSLSGGEAQRIKLAYFLGKGRRQEHTLLIFDEPTTGLHSKDISTLLKAFQSLINKGHTLIIIEHNPHIILAADHIIDLGPEGGEEGGHIVFEGTPEQLALCEQSYTGQFIKRICYPSNI